MTLETIIWLFEVNYDILRENLREITPEEMIIDPKPAGNNISWIFGHILESRNTILSLINEPPVLSDEEALPFKPFIKDVDRTKLLPVERMWAAWEESQKRLLEKLKSMTPEDMQEELPPWSEKGKPDKREKRLMFMHLHEIYHIGQFGTLRRLLGKEGAIG
jgi:uncharacterized damage-inducible protein DinB